MIYKSYCSIDIEYFPFDIQQCYMKFGTWTYHGELINLEHIYNKNTNSTDDKDFNERKESSMSKKLYVVEHGIDMTDYYQSVEWDVLSVPAQKNIKFYDCCLEPYFDIYFNITIRRKTLFYTVNLIIPCVSISFLSVLVFYLPSDSGEKLTLGISILVALLVFYLLLIELIPPTSLVIPLLGKYLLFTLILVNLSIIITIMILNLHHRKPTTHKMPEWMRKVFLSVLPKVLFITRPDQNTNKSTSTNSRESDSNWYANDTHKMWHQTTNFNNCNNRYNNNLPIKINKALDGIQFVNTKMKRELKFRDVN
jgi:nicotinic acetylcholine receptor